MLRYGYLLWTVVAIVGLTQTIAEKVEREDVLNEQERIKAYQMRIRNYLSAQANGSEMDQKTEPLQCYSCRNARSNEECNRRGMVTCLPTQTTCQTEVRVFNPMNKVNIRIRKGCKQEHACSNNFYQNEKESWPRSQCNYIPRTQLSVCRFCCKEPGCNKAPLDHVCGIVPVPEHGSGTCRRNHFRSSVCTFKCEPCHRLIGSRVRMCLENKLWSGKETECVFDETLPNCTSPTSCPSELVQPPANGMVECTDENNLGSECRFFCEKGYVLKGKRVLRCSVEKNEWDANTPTCVRGDDISNPCHPYAVFEYESDGSLNCECSTGFRGDGFIACEDIDECAEGRDICDFNAVCYNILGSYRCDCLDGYSGNGLECGDFDECLSDANDCDRENATCVNTDGSFKCVCKPEFTGDGRICTKVELGCPGILVNDICMPGAMSDAPTDHTSEELPTEPGTTVESGLYSDFDDIESCVKLTEGKPSMVRQSFEYEALNDRLLRKLIESSNNTRIVYGPWIGLDDRLEPGVLRWRDGKTLEKSDFQAWAPGQPKMVDNDGFGNCVNLVSDPVSSHTTSFLWQITLCSKPQRYVCESEKSDEPPIDVCLPLISIANGRMACTDGWRPGSACAYSCDSGYVLRGEVNRITCQENLMIWDNAPPVCVRAVCSQPLMPPNSGSMECTNENKEFSECTFSCKGGYTLHGNKTVTCQRNLKWSSQRPCCRDDCPPYARMNLILVLDSSRSIHFENFQLIKEFAKKLHRRFEVSEDFTHVSVITYSSHITVLDNITTYTSSDILDMALDHLPYEGAGTFIGQALDYVTENLIGTRPATGDVVVILTDGISHDDVYFPAKKLQAAGAHVISVGVEHAWRYQLQMIASEPTDMNIVEVDNYDGLNHIVNSISEKVCHFSC